MLGGNVDTLEISFDTVLQSSNAGIQLNGAVDTVRIRHSIVSFNGSGGVRLSGMSARIDTTVIEGNGNEDGVDIGLFAAAGVRIRATRIQGNGGVAGVGVRLRAGALNSFVRHSRIEGNFNSRGARSDGAALLDADTVYWGGAFGPRCAVAVTGCDPSAAGTTADSVETPGISFANYLTAPPVTPAPPAIRPAARALAGAAPAAPQHRQLSLARRPVRSSAARPAAPTGGIRTRLAWQRGRPPRPPAPRPGQ
jgi:hypothetical protein